MCNTSRSPGAVGIQSYFIRIAMNGDTSIRLGVVNR